jgi:hypothetical protein
MASGAAHLDSGITECRAASAWQPDVVMKHRELAVAAPEGILSHFGVEYNPTYVDGRCPIWGADSSCCGAAAGPSRAKLVHRNSEGLGRLWLSMVHQDLIANLDAFVADIHSRGTLSRIRDECLYLVLRFAAKRTSEDLVLVALGKHDPSMPGER